MMIPRSALGRDGAVAPGKRVVIGGIGIGNRGTYDLGCFLEQSVDKSTVVCFAALHTPCCKFPNWPAGSAAQ